MDDTTRPTGGARPDGKRLIEWTGERCVPWAEDIQMVYEHYHRYALALVLAPGKRVLDLACGEGFGAALMATAGCEVVAVDIDARTIEHAKTNYRRDNLTFEVASMIDPDALADNGTFDVVTCFEALEHVREQDLLMALVRRKIAAGGVFLASTPDVDVYNHEHGNENPFHVRELRETEFHALLSSTFAHVAVLRQNVATGSVMAAAEVSSPSAGVALGQSLQRAGNGGWEVTGGLPHTYLVGIASDEPLRQVPTLAVLADPALTLLGRAREQASADLVHALDQYRRSRVEVDELKASCAALEALRLEAEEAAAQDRRGARWRLDRMSVELDSVHRDLARLTCRAERAEARAAWMAEIGGAAERRAAALERDLDTLRAQQSPIAQRAISRYRGTIERSAPRGTRRRDFYERALGRSTGSVEALAPMGAVAVRTSATPLVSVIIPVHGKWSFTRQCLVSIEAHRPSVPFEVIVVDDASPDDTAEYLAASPGVRLVGTEGNRGFVGACNLGASIARGRYLVFLNNDTEVQPGWLDELVDTVDLDDRIGLVGAKLVYPDGRLQECGAIVWRDGTGWNYGRGDDPNLPQYQVVRDVDYCSGAALLVRRELFERVGGFDDRFAPAYYEDTDLAFAIRAAGHRTVVQPRAVVVHHEGISHGTDVTSGTKRFQELNRAAFVEKWTDALTGHLAAASETGVWQARERGRTGHRGGLVLVADHQVPTPDRDSGSVRLCRVLRELRMMGERVVFFSSNGSLLQPYTTDLQQMGVTVIADGEQQAAFLREAGPALTLAMLSRPAVAWRFLEELRMLAPNCLVAYDTVDLHFLRLQRQAELVASEGDGEHADALRRKAAASRELELGLVRATDLTVVVSDVEKDLLAELVPEAAVKVLSNVHEVSPSRTALQERADVLFVGSFDHLPNRDAARWMARDVMPLIWKRYTGTTLHIVGSNPSADVLALAGEGVDVHGWLPELAPMYASCRVSVAPLRFGAGVKGKVGESIAAGLPTVCTSIAVEGMHLMHGVEVLLADGAMEFADAVVALLTDDGLWGRLADAGPLAIATQFAPEAARSTLQDLLTHGNHSVIP